MCTDSVAPARIRQAGSLYNGAITAQQAYDKLKNNFPDVAKQSKLKIKTLQNFIRFVSTSFVVFSGYVCTINV